MYLQYTTICNATLGDGKALYKYNYLFLDRLQVCTLEVGIFKWQLLLITWLHQ